MIGREATIGVESGSTAQRGRARVTSNGRIRLSHIVSAGRRSLRWVPAVLIVGLSGCGPGNATVDPADNPPPDVLANGVPGVVVSYCRTIAYCADGGIDFEAGDYPSIDLPITLTFEEPIFHITAYATSTGRNDAPVEMIGVDVDGRPLRHEITIEQLPAGDWQVLLVDVGFDGEVSSSAVWNLFDQRR